MAINDDGRKKNSVDSETTSIHRTVIDSLFKSKTTTAVDADDLSVYLHKRKNKERKDSITPKILLDRKIHREKIDSIDADDECKNVLELMGLGSRRRINLRADRHSRMQEGQENLIGAGGFAVHLTSAARRWPVFKHILPEVAFTGHTNSGKSSLVNAVSGLAPRAGPAKVSERAGWTDQICFFQLGRRPPKLILADMPGYGHAVASATEMKRWTEMTRSYIEEREVLSLCCVLVDCTRGLCSQDIELIRFLFKKNIFWRVVLTKCDLLTCDDLARCLSVVSADLQKLEHDVQTNKSAKLEKQRAASDGSEKIVASKTISESTSNDTDTRIPEINSNLEESLQDEKFKSHRVVESSPFSEKITLDSSTTLEPSTESLQELHNDEIIVESEDEFLELIEDPELQSNTGGSDEYEVSAKNGNVEAPLSITSTEMTKNQISISGKKSVFARIIPVSSFTGAGLRELWQTMLEAALDSTYSPTPTFPHDMVNNNPELLAVMKRMRKANESGIAKVDCDVGLRHLKLLMQQNSLTAPVSTAAPSGPEHAHDHVVREHYKAKFLRRNSSNSDR